MCKRQAKRLSVEKNMISTSENIEAVLRGQPRQIIAALCQKSRKIQRN